MTRSSVAEQASAALDRLTADENARIAVLNAAYRARHGFPFIVAALNNDHFTDLVAIGLALFAGSFVVEESGIASRLTGTRH